jgi:hypothetical protein
LQGSPKLTQIRIFGLKISHLATLAQESWRRGRKVWKSRGKTGWPDWANFCRLGSLVVICRRGPFLSTLFQL